MADVVADIELLDLALATLVSLSYQLPRLPPFSASAGVFLIVTWYELL